MIIEPVRPADWTAAMERALARVPAQQRGARVCECVELLANGTLDPRGVWVARLGQEIVGVQVCVCLAGSACLFWLPDARGDCPESADLVVQAGLNWCRAQGCKIAQALADPIEHAWTEPLCRQGFRPITRLCQLTRDLVELPVATDTRLRYLPYRPALAADFARVLERTYERTLDCPELNGVRAIDEILAGHRAQGKFDADFWWLALDGDVPVGVVMLVELADGLTWELAYLGLIPERRGRRLGLAMLLHALHALRASMAVAVTVAVDERNRPARALYQSLGFVELDSSDVLLHLFP